MKQEHEKHYLEMFELEELESRFEMAAWITIYESCDCDGDGCDDNVPHPDCEPAPPDDDQTEGF